jgi:hypothetical protein
MERAPPPPSFPQRRQDPPRQQEHDDQEDRRVADQVELGRAEPVREVLLRGHQDERAEHRPPQRALAAEERHQHHADRHQRVDGELRVDERDVVRPDAPAGRLLLPARLVVRGSTAPPRPG